MVVFNTEKFKEQIGYRERLSQIPWKYVIAKMCFNFFFSGSYKEWTTIPP